MKIGIDISQTAYGNTGVANYLTRLVSELVRLDSNNEYVLFYSSMRKNFQFSIFPFGKLRTSSITQSLSQSNDLSVSKGNFQSSSNVTIRKFKFPPKFLDLMWNKLHVLPIENLIGDVDLFISSDWTQPPTKKAKKATILYDLIVYKHPEETAKEIVETQRRRLKWVKKECDMVFCISESTKKDAMEVLGIEEGRLEVIGAGI